MRTMVKSFGWLAGEGKSSRRKHVAFGKRRTQRQARYSSRMPVADYLCQRESDAQLDAQAQADAYILAQAELVEQYYQAQADARTAFFDGQQALQAELDPAAEQLLDVASWGWRWQRPGDLDY